MTLQAVLGYWSDVSIWDSQGSRRRSVREWMDITGLKILWRGRLPILGGTVDAPK
jgi:hypothetical protein